MLRVIRWALVAAAFSVIVFSTTQAIFLDNKNPYVQYKTGQGLALLDGKSVIDIVTDADDYPGVVRAVKDLQSDFGRVSSAKVKPDLISYTNGSLSDKLSNAAIIIGSLKSKLIQELADQGKINGSALTGKWESFQVSIVQDVKINKSKLDKALIIVGSDKRGTIYGTYDLSEQIGVSPWYFWADVTPIRRNSLAAVLTSTYSRGEPTIKYRGIFLNDEQPALTNYVNEKYGPVYNSKFYATVFELLLRLRANYLWPTMWDSMFGVDDPLNQQLADEYGIVMSTSHQEPMMRATKEWNTIGKGDWNYTTNSEFLKQFWDDAIKRSGSYEQFVTIGMRGSGDIPYSKELGIEIQEEIVRDQRAILAKYNLSTTHQQWCLYSEVQGYFEIGMRVPDDVTLLWADDNWGNIRRLPVDAEANRTGGAGVYYHFDVVGGPRSYKWINTNQIEKIIEQMSLAIERSATELWVVNVGDLKPMEIPIDFFLAYGYDSSLWTVDNVDQYLTSWAAREFGDDADVKEIADLVSLYTKYNARRKPELIDPSTYSNLYFSEAETILAEWASLEARAEKAASKIPTDKQAAFFELVQHPIQASSTVNQIYIHTGYNNLYVGQVGNRANNHRETAEKLFLKDQQLTDKYHGLLGGKWNHMMDQPHLNYQYWQQPLKNTLPGLGEVNTDEEGLPGPLAIAIQGLKGAWPGDNQFQCAQGYNCPPPTLGTMSRYGKSSWIDVFSRSKSTFAWTATTNVTWVKLSSKGSTFTSSKNEERVTVSIDWNSVPVDATGAAIVFNSTAKGTQAVTVSVPITTVSAPSSFAGHIEADGYVSIEAPHFTRSSKVDGVEWKVLPKYGKTLGAVTPFPRTAKSFASASTSPLLEYDVYLFNTPPNGKLNITSFVAPALNQDPNRPLQYKISVDDTTPVTVNPIPSSAPGSTPSNWNDYVANQILLLNTTHSVSSVGKHTVKYWMVEPNVVLEKIVLDVSGKTPIKTTYLGPPESTIASSSSKLLRYL